MDIGQLEFLSVQSRVNPVGFTMLTVIVLFLASLSLSLAAPHPSPSKPTASFLPPTISFLDMACYMAVNEAL